MIAYVKDEKLSSFATLRHGFFTREGGVSVGPLASLNCSETVFDDPLCVAENRTRVAQALGVTMADLATVKQVHSAHVVTATHAWTPQDRPEADGIVTQRKGLALGILTADCAPVLFADPLAGVIGAAHAGWRGALGGVLERTVEAMEALGAARGQINAAIGPCIWQDSYEVSPAFMIPFLKDDEANERFFKGAEKRGHFLFDLPSYVEARLAKMNLAGIGSSPADTYRNETQFYSFRRGFVRGQKEDGRMLSCVMLVER